MNKLLLLVASIVVLLLTTSSRTVFAMDMSAEEIMTRSDQEQRSADEIVTMTLTLITSNGDKRTRTVIRKSKTGKNNLQKTLIRFLSPRNVEGVGFLILENSDRDDDRWLFLPAINRTQRISSNQRTDNFMGTDFTYEDMQNISLKKYSHNLVGEQKYDGFDTYTVELKPKSAQEMEESGYQKRIFWIDKKSFLPVKVEFYGKSGSLLKVLNNRSILRVGVKWRYQSMDMINNSTEHRTTVEFSNTQIDSGQSDQEFTERSLSKGAQ